MLGSFSLTVAVIKVLASSKLCCSLTLISAVVRWSTADRAAFELRSDGAIEEAGPAEFGFERSVGISFLAALDGLAAFADLDFLVTMI